MLAHGGAANARSYGVSCHRRAMVTGAKDVVQLHLFDAKERNSSTHRVIRKAFGAQPRIVEGDRQWRLVGPYRRSLCRRRRLDLEQRLEPSRSFALQRLRPALKTFGFR